MYMKLRNSQSGKEEIAQSHPALKQTQSRLCPAPSGAATSARPPAGRSFHRAMVLCAKPSQQCRPCSVAIRGNRPGPPSPKGPHDDYYATSNDASNSSAVRLAVLQRMKSKCIANITNNTSPILASRQRNARSMAFKAYMPLMVMCRCALIFNHLYFFFNFRLKFLSKLLLAVTIFYSELKLSL